MQKNTPGPRNLLTLLPDEFTTADAERIRQTQGMDARGTQNMLRQWVYRRYVTVVTDDSYQKLKYRSHGADLTQR